MRFSSVPRLLLAALAAATPALGASAGVPLLYETGASDRANAPVALAAQQGTDGTRLLPTAAGRVNVSFDAGRFVYLGFAFETAGSFAVTVAPEGPLASVRVFANGAELTTVSGHDRAFTAPTQSAGAYSVVVRLERADARQVPVTISLNAFSSCATLLPNPCGQVLDAAPAGLTYDLAKGAVVETPADVLIPAVTRAEGVRGPVRSDLSLANRTATRLALSLSFTGADGTRTAPTRLILAPYSRQRIEDVVAYLFHEPVSAQGVLAIRGFVPLAAGDVTAETYYDQGDAGHIGTTLPLFVGESTRVGSTVLAGSTEGNPRLVVFSSATDGGLTLHEARLIVMLGGEPLSIPISVYGGSYASARIFDLTGGQEGDGLLSLESDDPTLHAVLIRNDAASGSPFVVAAN